MKAGWISQQRVGALQGKGPNSLKEKHFRIAFTLSGWEKTNAFPP
jgi:hypothetical protein